MRGALILGIAMLLIGSVSASYIEGDIYLSSDGKAIFELNADKFEQNIEGVSFLNGKIRGGTEELISKQKGIWTFSLDFGEYDTILVEIHLPKQLDKIISLSGAKGLINIGGKSVLVSDLGDFNFSISYSIKESKDYSWFYWLIGFFIVVIIYFLYRRFKLRKERLENAFSYIGANEQKILESVIDKRIRQKELREKLGIPKASFTRYLLNLEKKKLIFREGEGKNKWVKAI